MATPTLTARELGRATLARQLLLERSAAGVVEAVRQVGGLQAQEPGPPFLGLWSRLEGFESGALLEALRSRAVVRGTMMRGTLHLVTADDYAAVRPSLQPMLVRAMASALRERAAGLEPDAVLPVARSLLAERPRGFEELRELLQAEFPAVNERALGYCVRMLLPLVMVPAPEERWGYPRVASFTLAEEWLGVPLAGAAEPDALVLRYLAAFGPASVADVQAWSGLPGLAAVLEQLRDGLVTLVDERGRELFDLPDAPRPGAEVPAPARLLPEFDSVLLAHADRTRVIAEAHRPAVVTKNLRVRATFLLDGMVAGTWSVKRTKRQATLTLAPFRALRAGEVRALQAEGEALLRLSDPDAGSVSVGLAD